jgi:hypothetical protein
LPAGIDLFQSGSNDADQTVNSGCQGLDNERISILVHDQSGKAVSFAEHGAKGIAEAEHFPKRARRRDPPPEEFGIDLLLLSRKNADSDEGVRVDVSAADEPVCVIENVDELSGRELRGHVLKLVAEHPRVSAQNAPFFFIFEFYGFHE